MCNYDLHFILSTSVINCYFDLLEGNIENIFFLVSQGLFNMLVEAITRDLGPIRMENKKFTNRMVHCFCLTL